VNCRDRVERRTPSSAGPVANGNSGRPSLFPFPSRLSGTPLPPQFCRTFKTLELSLLLWRCVCKIFILKDLKFKILETKELLAISYAICAVFIFILIIAVIALSNDGADLRLPQGWMSQHLGVDSRYARASYEKLWQLK